MAPSPPDTSGGWTWGDFLNTALASGAQIEAGAGALGRAASEKSDDPVAQFTGALGQYFSETASQFANERLQDMTPVASASLNAAFGSEDFWKHPLLSTALKATSMAPAVAAALAPTGIMASATAGMITGAGTFGAMSAGDVVDQIYKMTDGLSDDELRKQSAAYAELRAQGTDEKSARAQYNEQLMGMKPLISFVVGAAAGLVPAGAAGKGLVSGVVKGGVTGAAAVGAQSATQDVLTQQAETELGTKPGIDVGQAAGAGVQGAITGGVLGGAGGALHGRGEEKPVVPPPTVEANRGVTVLQPGQPSADQIAALTARADNRPATPPPAAPAAPVGRPPEVAARPPEVAPPEAAPVAPAVAPRVTPGVIDNPIVADEIKRSLPPTPPEQPPVSRAPATSAEAPRAPRILPDLTPEAQKAAAEAKAGNAQQIAANVKAMEAEGKPGPGSKDSARVAKRQADGVAAQALFDKHAPDKPTLPQSPADVAALKSRLDTILNSAKEQGLKIPAKVGYASTPDHLVWLREVQSLRQKFIGDRTPTDAAIQTFIGREAAAKGGDFSVMRSERAGAGEEIMGKYQGDAAEIAAKPVEEAPAPGLDHELAQPVSVGGAEKDAVQTAVPKSAKRSVQTFDEERAAKGAPVKKIEITPEIAAKYNKAGTKGKAAVDTAKNRAGAKEETKPSAKAAKAKEGRVIGGRLEPDAYAHANDPHYAAGYEDAASDKDFNPPKGLTKTELAGYEFGYRGGTYDREDADRARTATRHTTEPLRIAHEARRVETKPTEAQKEAGNYQKGHVKVHGLDITIENPRGSVRSGKTQEGADWSVKMPDHYGYVKRTEGADGDQVDAYIGPKPESPHVFVIDQVNPDTRAFDEHKAMLGYDNLADAMKAYDKSFSDGRGMERIGNYTVFTADEFKTWLKEGNTKKPISDAEITRPAFEADRTIDTGFGPGQIPMRRSALDGWRQVEPGDAPARGEQIPVVDRPRFFKENATQSGSFAHIAQQIFNSKALLDQVTGAGTKVAALGRSLAPLMLKRIIAVAGDVKVHILPDEAFHRTIEGSASAYYDYSHDVIVVSESALGDPGRASHVILHEGVHAAFLKATWMHPHIRAGIQYIADEAAAAYRRLQMPDGSGFSTTNNYAFSNLDEFIAEAFSNPSFQSFLARVPASSDLAAGLEANRSRGIGGQIRTLWQSLLDAVRRALNIESVHNSLLDGILQVGAELEFKARELSPSDRPFSVADQMARAADITSLSDDPIATWHAIKENPASAGAKLEIQAQALTDKAKELLTRADQATTAGRPRLLKAVTMDHIARTADAFFGKDHNPVRAVAGLIERTRVAADRLMKAAEPTVTKIFDMEKKYRGETWDKFTALVHDETMAGVYSDKSLADNKQLGKDSLSGVWGKAQHADRARRYAELPEDLKQLRRESMKFFTDQQNAMSLSLIKNSLLKALDINDAGLAQRIHEGDVTEADKARVGPELLTKIMEAKELSKITGPYFPLMRRGDHVVVAHYKIAPPTGPDAKALSENEFEFSGPKARDNAIAFAKNQETRPTISSVWVDKTTGGQYVTDADGKEIKVTPQDTNAEQRFHVVVQNKHVEFVDGQKEALRRQKALEQGVKDGLFTKVDPAQQRKADPSSGKADLLSHQMVTLVNSLRRRDDFKAMTPKMQNELVQALHEASLRMLGSTRIQTKRLPRRYVEGASHDLTLNAYEYARSTSGYLARLEHQPAIDDAMKEMDAGVSNDYAAEGTLGRSAIAKEVHRRVDGLNGFVEGNKKYSPAVQRLLTSSFISHLASVSYSVVNATQPILLTVPHLAGRYGIGRAVGAMSRAYADIGAAGMIKSGAADTMKKIRSARADTTSFLDGLKGRSGISARELSMFDELATTGKIDPEGGMEVGAFMGTRGAKTLGKKAVAAFDKGLNTLDAISRQMPTAIEAINRYVSALAAYRLEFDRTGDHEAAVRHAGDVVDATQFNYSATNAPPIFNHPLARIAFQFKKFGMGVYQLLGQQIGKAYRNAEAGDRAEAIKTLAYIATMHVAAAGTLGLPTEPIKALLMGAHMAGLTGASWQDVENWERQTAAGVLGKTGGEMLTRGLTRGIPGGFAPDVSGRLGLDTLFTFGEPKTTSKDDAFLWFANTLGGAPWGMAESWYTGAQKLTSGDLMGAAHDLIPMKTAADAIKAYQTATEGKKSGTGQSTMSPYSLPEAAVRILGFTPGREAEDQSKRAAFYGKQAADTAARTSLTDRWINAAPADRQRMWGQVESFNAGQDPSNRLTRTQLNAAVKRRDTSVSSGATRAGIRTTARTKALLDRLDQTYGAQ